MGSEPQAAVISTDYLVIGAGISGLGFTDELLTRLPSATITIVDKRDAPGGHWNDVYPFVKLHAPSTTYGVASKELSDFKLEERGLNKGLQTLATGAEVVAYCHSLMKDRFLRSGRVVYLPSSEYLASEGVVRSLFSGETVTIDVKKKLVNASHLTNSVPVIHTPSFTTASSVTCIPPNSLPRLAPSFQHFTVVGGGKTSIDSCIWLLTNGVPPSRLRWIVPNDYWYIHRTSTQNHPGFFDTQFKSILARSEAMAEAEDYIDLTHRFEKTGRWHRLDKRVEPMQFHSAIVSEGEMEELRKIEDIVRKGYVTAIEVDEVVLTKGTVPARPNTLYIDCTACALPRTVPEPVYQPSKITVQLVRSPLISVSAGLIAFIESLPMTDDERNALVQPITYSKTTKEYMYELATELRNRSALSNNPATKKWMSEARLEGFKHFTSEVDMETEERQMMLMKVAEAGQRAASNMPKLIASTGKKMPDL